MSGYIIQVMGGKGGVGKSAFAANLAFAWAQETKQKVLLLDFDQRACGDQALITGIKSPKTLKDLADFSGAIDPKSILMFLGQHKDGVHVVNMPTEQTSAESVNPENLGKTLKAVTSIYPLTIIDGGSELSPLALKGLEFSTLILLVVTPDVLAANQTKRLYTDLVTLLFPKDMMQIVLNQFVNGHPVNADVVGRQIGKPVFGLVPKDDQNCTAALSRST